MGAHQVELDAAYDIAAGARTTKSVLSRGAVKASFQNNWTGTVAGTFVFQGSNHRLAIDAPNDARVIWTTLTVSLIHGTNPPAGAPASMIAIMTNLPYAIRQVFTPSGGAGLLATQLDLDDSFD